MRIGSLFSGIGAFELAAARLGWEVRWASEIIPFAVELHARRFPGCRQLGDVTQWEPDPERDAVDLITAGFPCQDLSVAGLRAGLKGGRSGLFFEVVRAARILRPRWVVLENVPGLLSSPPGEAGGRDFAAVLAALDGLGYGLGWRVLDARGFGVAQRRYRVFVVGHLGAECPAAVLFEPAGLRRDPRARRPPRADPAPGAVSRAVGRVGGGDDPGAGKGAALVFTQRGRGDGQRLEWREDATYALTNPGAGGRRDENNVLPPESHVVDMGGGKGGARVSRGEVPTLNTSAAGHALFTPALVSAAAKGPGNTQDGFVVAPAAFEDAEGGEDDPLGVEDQAIPEPPPVRRSSPDPIADPGQLALLASGPHASSSTDPAQAPDHGPLGFDWQLIGTPTEERSGTLTVTRVQAVIPAAAKPEPMAVNLAQVTSRENRTVPEPGGPAPTLAAADRAVVFDPPGAVPPLSASGAGTGRTGNERTEADFVVLPPEPVGFKPAHFTRGHGSPPADEAGTLALSRGAGDQTTHVNAGGPRRLTPLECERLQGFPDGWTCTCGALEAQLAAAGVAPEAWLASHWRTVRLDGLTAACRCKDSPRYRALGNAVCVPVAEWILRRVPA